MLTHETRWHVAVAVGLIFAGVVSGAEHTSSPGSATSAAAGDGRAPLPLPAMMAAHQKQNMREHLAAIQDIVGALAAGDMDGVAKAARRIGYSESMGQMCEHMGAAAPGFTRLAVNFHHIADTIGDVARKGDRAGALVALHRTLAACVECHASYRQEIVDEDTWERLTAGAPSPPSSQ